MNGRNTVTAAGILSLLVAAGAHAELFDRGGGLVYDSVLDVTWLQNANYFPAAWASSGYTLVDDVVAAVGSVEWHPLTAGDFDPVTGRMSWWGATAWAQTLAYADPAGGSPLTGWMLPSVDQMNHLVFTDLGATPGASFSHNANYALFENIETLSYWLHDQVPGSNIAYSFITAPAGFEADLPTLGLGDVIQTFIDFHTYAWLLRPGDVTGAPNPPGDLSPNPNTGFLSVAASRTQTVPFGNDGEYASLQIETGITLTVETTLTNRNNGTITVFGSLISHAGSTLVNDASAVNVLENGLVVNDASAIVNRNGSQFNVGGQLFNDDSAVVTNESGAIFINQGTVVNWHGSQFINKGTLHNVLGANLHNDSGGRFDNIGLIQNNGAVVNQDGGTFLNHGAIENQAGAYLIVQGGDFQNFSVVTNAGNVSHSGGTFTNTGTIENSGVFQNIPANVIDNQGTFTDTGSVVNNGALANSGTFVVEVGASVTGSGIYTQTGHTSRTKVLGTMSQSQVIIDDGTLGGSGTINGWAIDRHSYSPASVTVNHAARIRPGDPVTLTIDGSLTLNGGTIEIAVAGVGDGQYDVLNVTGPVVFNGGTVLFDFIDGYVPKLGDSFDFLKSSVTTGFDTLSFLYAGLAPGFEFAVTPGTSGLDFVALANASAVPVPSALFLLGPASLLLAVNRVRSRPY